MRPTRILSTALLVLTLSTPLLARSPVNRTFFGGVAIDGYDPVAYFTDGRAVEGREDFEYEWKGATWRFASAAHRDLFAASPAQYAPQYGGYCAWAVSQGSTADVDPEVWTVFDGKLYLNYDAEIRKKWLADKENLIEKADENWPGLVDE